MKSNRTRLAAGIFALGSLLTPPARAQDQAGAPARFVTFAVPGACFTNTCVSGIDPGSSVDVVGSWVDKRNITHGYLRAPNGAFMPITPPGAVDLVVGPLVPGPVINAVGSVAGLYRNALSQVRGFVRSRRGNFTLFDVPGHRNVPSPPAITALSPTGTLGGYYAPKGSNFSLGFLRNPDGSLVSFAVAASTSTEPTSIDAAGVVVGNYGVNGDVHGFVRTPDGVLTTFDAPGAFLFSYLVSINALGEIAGSYSDRHNTFHGFLRSPKGSITIIDAPGAAPGKFGGTFADALDPAGDIAGTYTVANDIAHGYLRSRDGTITSFDVPNAVGTFPVGINARCVIAGTYADARGTERGFLRFPAGGPASAAGTGPVCR